MNRMNTGSNPYLEQALAEHHDLHRNIEEIGSLLETTAARDASTELVGQALARVKGLCSMLRQHFAQEEEGGYLEEAIARLPSLAPQAAILQKQHAEFIETANKLIAAAEGASTPAGQWQAMQEGFRMCSKKLLAHEAAENAVLQRAYNVDLGLEP